jgi:hypothetical protein
MLAFISKEKIVDRFTSSQSGIIRRTEMKKIPDFDLEIPTDDELSAGNAVPLPQAVSMANSAGLDVKYGSVYRAAIEGKIPATRVGGRLYMRSEAVIPSIQNFTLDKASEPRREPVGPPASGGWMNRAEFSGALSASPNNHVVYAAALPGGDLQVRKTSGGRIADQPGAKALYSIVGSFSSAKEAEDAARASGAKIRGQKRTDPSNLRVSELSELLRSRVGGDPKKIYSLVRKAVLEGRVPSVGDGRSRRISAIDAEDFIERWAQKKEK